MMVAMMVAAKEFLMAVPMAVVMVEKMAGL